MLDTKLEENNGEKNNLRRTTIPKEKVEEEER